MSNERKLPFGFERVLTQDENNVLEVLSTEDGMLLTRIALSLDTIEETEDITSLLDRGMAEWKDERLEVTEKGMKAVSLYPLLGTKRTRRIYPEAFFPFLLSIAASGMLPSSRWQKSINSDFFTSLFPSIEKERAIKAAEKSIEALIHLGVIKDDDTTLSISKELSLSFLSLKEEERLALVISEECVYDREKCRRMALFINLASKISDVEEIENYLDTIKSITGSSVSLSDLLLFSILEIEDGRYTGRKLPEESTEHFAISSDFSITYTGKTPEDICLYASPVMTDRTTEWRITKQSAKAAFSLSLTPEKIKESLSGVSSYAIPETIYPRIALWYSSYSSLSASRALILVCDERNARILDALPTLQMHIEKKLSDTIYIMKRDTEALWRRALENAGFDMLGRTEGPQFKTEEKGAEIIQSSFTRPAIREERAVPFNRELKEKLILSSPSPFVKALAISGFITRENESIELPEMVNGLYYQEKMRLIRKAEDENLKIYAEFIDGSALVGHVRKADDESILILGKTVEQCKIWKTAILPVSIRDLEMHPSDNDSQ